MKYLMLACAAAMALSSAVSAEELKIGAKVGLNMSNVSVEQGTTSEDFDTKMSFTLGASVDIPLSDLITFQTGVQYAMKGAKDDADSSEIDLNFIEIPAIAKFNLAEGAAYAAAGLNIGILSKAESTGGGETNDLKDDMKTLNLELVLGGGATLLDGKLSVGGQYEMGLSNLADWPAGGFGPTELKTKNIAIVVGYTF